MCVYLNMHISFCLKSGRCCNSRAGVRPTKYNDKK